MKDERKFMKHERCKCEQNMEAAKELLLSGNFEAAIPHYDRAIAACGNHMAWSNKGICLDELGKMDEALVCYENSIKEEPGYAFAWNNKGTNLARQQQFDMALECFTRAVNIDPSYLQAIINKGSASSDLGRYEEAVACFKKAISIEPSNQRVKDKLTYAQVQLSEGKKSGNGSTQKKKPGIFKAISRLILTDI